MHPDIVSRLQLGQRFGCPDDQLINFELAQINLLPKQLAASAAARLCDNPDGPTAVGTGGARGGGKSFWLVAQIGLDDCQRFPGLKCLILRKVGKSNREHFEDLRQRVFRNVPHEYSQSGELVFPNGSRILIDHYQHESDLDKYIGIEYDVIGIEEATGLTLRKYTDIRTCCRSSKVGPDGKRWRPRIYSTTNPGGIGHTWYRNDYIVPFQTHNETSTRFIPSRVEDNPHNNPEYRLMLDTLPGWRKRAWRYGDWEIAAGQFFSTFRRNVHVIEDFDETRAIEWFASFDYGFTHYTVVLLGCKDGDGNIFIVDEHVQKGWIPERHAAAIKALLDSHQISPRKPVEDSEPSNIPVMRYSLVRNASGLHQLMPLQAHHPYLSRFVAGTDVFSKQSNGSTIANEYIKFGIRFSPANTERVSGWAQILTLLGDPDAGIRPRLFIHQRCRRLLECLPALQHDPNQPEDVLKVDVDEDGTGGDDTADALRYMIATKPRILHVCKLLA